VWTAAVTSHSDMALETARRSVFVPPRLRSEHGIEEGRKVTWLELFFDLVFVAAVAQVGTHLRDDYSLPGLLRFSFLFVLIWWAWLGHTTFLTRFDTDDLIQRALTGLQMFLVAVMAINATGALDSRDSAGFAAAYSVMRFILVGQYLRVRHVRQARALTTRYAAGCGTAAAMWLVSAVVPAPGRFAIWALALTVDVLTPLLTTRHLVNVPHDGAHLPERYGLFSIILIGESMVAVMAGMGRQEYWSLNAAASAILGMTLVFAVWWWYFDGVDAVAERVMRSNSDAVRFHIWSYAHLPLYLGIAVAGVGVEHVIVTATTAPLTATEGWILCSAIAALMVAMMVIGRTHHRANMDHSVTRLAVPGVVVVLVLVLGISADRLMPSMLLAGVTILCLAQLIHTVRSTPG
jgi:low temperature requirement protein LtrA